MAIMVPMAQSLGQICSLRPARILIVLIVLIVFVTVTLNNEALLKPTTTSANNATAAAPSFDDVDAASDHFSLCGRKLYLKDLPYVPSSSSNPEVQFGITNWTRSFDNAAVFIHLHNPQQIHGRTGNQIRGFFHAFDYARDVGGALVIHPTGFPLDTTLRKLYLGLEQEDLEEMGLIMYDSVPEEYRSKMFVLGTRFSRDYVSKSAEYSQYDTIQQRHFLIQKLYRMTARDMALHPDSPGTADMCASFHAFFGKDDLGVTEESLKSIGISKKITQRYTTIHSRSFEGKQFLEEARRHYGADPLAGDYPPDMIKYILEPLGMLNSTILMITDGQNTEIMNRLSSDPTIGSYFQVVPEKISTMTGDILLAILSEVFIGNAASSFSQYITMVRYALGRGHSYLHLRRNPLSEKWETYCGDESCFYYLHDLEAQTHQPAAPKTIP